MTLVIDASAVLAWLLPDEVSVDLSTLIAAHDGGFAPSLLWVEVRNSLIMSERRSRIPFGGVERFTATFDKLHLTYDTTPNSRTVLALCRDHRLTAYDALYLELALRRKASLVTGDARLAEAARKSGVTVLER